MPVDPGEGHTVRSYDNELSDLRLTLLEMAALALGQVESAVRALLSGNDEAARSVIARDREVNDFEARLTDDTVRLLAQRQPLATDLRAVIAIGRAVRDLERIGDEAKTIALYAMEIHSAGPKAPLAQFYRDVRRMAQLTTGMLRDAIRAFDELDVPLAEAIGGRDADIDHEFRGAMRHLVSLVMEDQAHLSHTINTVFVIKALERIGDHAVNLAEAAIYLMRGRAQQTA
jgi:phosphate transport system protein